MNIINMLSESKLDKTSTLSVTDGALYAVLAIVMVFAILLIIIGITSLVFKLTGLFELKKELEKNKENVNDSKVINSEINIEDDDMMAAILTATIDYRNETKKDVKVINVKRIK